MIDYLGSFIPSQETIVFWLEHYGSFALFGLLALGIIALPVPEETLMVITGALMRHGVLEIPPTLAAAYAGSCCGITVSYLIGITGGHYLLHKYGPYIWITEEKLAISHRWFKKAGKWSLIICYFIPGLRHFVGVFAGISELDFPRFALFAYTGSILWVTTFISFGYFFGKMEDYTLKHIVLGLAGALIVASILYLIYHFKNSKDHK